MSNFDVPWIGDFVPWEMERSQTRYLVSQPQIKYQPIIWKPNTPFRASFRPENVSTGVHRILMVNTANDAHFWIRANDFEEAFYNTAIVFGVFIGEWEFRQTKGRYFGLKLVK